jgi:carbamoyl-phosphate synthase large subunit
VHILGTSADSLDLAEDRERFAALLDSLGIAYPPHAFARSTEEARAAAERLGFPVLLRPSHVLGGRAMAIVYEGGDLEKYVDAALDAAPGAAVLVDRFLEDAIEVDVDAVADGDRCIVAGILQHVEHAGVHSGDSSCVLPPPGLADHHLDAIRDTTRALASGLNVVGLMNVQYAVFEDRLYVLEVNPRASRTVPFVAKATGVPLAKLATRVMLGSSLAEVGLESDLEVDRYFVKAPVFPFRKFPGADPRLLPEMRSTGEVMGADQNLGVAFRKAYLGAGLVLPDQGTVFITVNQRDKKTVVPAAQRLLELGFSLVATRGTAGLIRDAGLEVEEILKRSEGRPNCVDAIKSGQIALVINTPMGESSFEDGWAIRTAALDHGVPCVTTLSGAEAVLEAIAASPEARVSCIDEPVVE